MKKNPNSSLSKLIGKNVFRRPHLGLALAKKRKLKISLSTRFRKNWMEKAKLKYIYGYLNRSKLSKISSLSREEKVWSLESQLANVVYKAGFAPTIRAAQQLVSHGHVLLNGQISTEKSQPIAIGDMIELDQRILNQAQWRLSSELRRKVRFLNCASYLEVNLTKMNAILVEKPSHSSLKTHQLVPVPIDGSF